MRKTTKLTGGLVLSAGLVVAVTAGVDSGLSGASSAETTWTYASTELTPADDSHASVEKPTLNYGSGEMVIARSTARAHNTAYLKFNVPKDLVGNGKISKAVLRLTPRAPGWGTMRIVTVPDTNWTESTLTERNAPALGTKIATISTGDKSARTVDLSQAVTSPGVYTFAITAESASAYSSYFTKESGATMPVLTVEVATPVVPACVARFAGDPACADKLYFGASVQGSDPAAFESSIGSKVGVFRSYMNSSTSASSFANRARGDLANSRLPLISTKVPNGDWAGVASGRHDAWLLDRIRALAAVDGPVWLCLHHEPTGDGAPADWVAMQKHARKLIDANSTNIALVGILNGWDFRDNQAGNEDAWNHPVGSGVHIMGYDSYNQWSPTNGNRWVPADEVLGLPTKEIQSWGYPTLVAEYGVRTDPTNPGKAAQWLKDAQAYAAGHDLLAMSYFNSGLNSPDGPWTLDGERLTAYAQLIKNAQTAKVGS